MRFTVAVTRPEPQARETASRLRARGYDVVLAPLLAVRPLDGWGSAEGIGALALTSRTAARLLADHPQFHGLPTFCVGTATAREAREAGARDVIDAAGDAADLAALLTREGRAPVVHISGAEQRGDLVAALEAAGVAAERRVVYRMTPATALPDVAGALDATLLYSPRTAAIYRALARRAPWSEAACVALSPAVAAEAPAGVPVAVAATPDEPALLVALDGLCAGPRRDRVAAS